MAVPRYDEIMLPFLETLKDGKEKSLREIRDLIAEHFSLSEDDLSEKLSSGTQNMFVNRVAWASTYLRHAGLIENTNRTILKITETGKKVLEEHPQRIDRNYLMQFPKFVEFVSPKQPNIEVRTEQVGNNFADKLNDAQTQNSSLDDSRTPDEIIEETFKELNNQLAHELLDKIKSEISPYDFEQFVVDLFHKIGYGEGHVTPKTRDKGIDGILMEDSLGLDLIYIQAKKIGQEDDSKISRPEIQKFIGAIAVQGGNKGIFVTTAKFSNDARACASEQKMQRIKLIDGEELVELMIKHNFGVRTKTTFEIKDIDTDTFNDYSDD